MSFNRSRLVALGWRASHSQQVSVEELSSLLPARVTSVHRDRLDVLGEEGELSIRVPAVDGRLSESIAVGDWLLIDQTTARVERRLEPFSCLQRVAAGIEARRQLIASNVDTLFIAVSCNEDFNLSRLERYLAIAHQAAVAPVVVLTKADECDDLTRRIADAQAVAPLAAVIAIDARDRASADSLTPWLAVAQTVAFVGSSGVGKSTLINTLLGIERQTTAAIREDDSKGRHTTTARQLVRMPAGAWLIDTPGMRELRIGDAAIGVQATFEDIEQLAAQCKFRDCRHQTETGCAVIAAACEGRLDARRIENYRKLQREAAHANATLAERRERERRFGRLRNEVEKMRKKTRMPPS